jgi:hypothetical protein
MTDHKPTAQARWLSFALVAFPVGLMLGLAIAMWLYYANKDKERQRTYGHALALRREVNQTDIERYLRIFSEAGALAPADRLGTVRGFLESTLGAANMGYNVKSETMNVDGGERVHLSVELPGTRKARDVVLVLATYGEDGGEAQAEHEALALLLSLAHSFTGTPQHKTLHFLALDVSGAAAVKDARLREVVSGLASQGFFLDETVDLNERPASDAPLLEQARVLEQTLQRLAGRL